MNLFQILENLCEGEFGTLISSVKWAFNLLLFAIPLVLIIKGTIDMFKAMTSGDEKEAKTQQKKLITRIIYGVVAFIIPFVVNLVFSIVAKALPDNTTENAKTTVKDFMTCWSGGNTETTETDER